MCVIKAIYTICNDVDLNFTDVLARRGFETHWDTYVETLNLDKISKMYNKMALSMGVVVKSIPETNWYWNMTTMFLE